MPKPKRISIGALESLAQAKCKSDTTLPASAIRIDIATNDAGDVDDERPNEELELVPPSQPIPSTMCPLPTSQKAAGGLENVPSDEPSPPSRGRIDDKRDRREAAELQMPGIATENEAGSDDSMLETQSSEPAQLPVARAINDDMLPQAFVLDDATLSLPTVDPNEKERADEEDARYICRQWKTLAIVLALILFVVMLSIGLTGGFQPEKPPPPDDPDEPSLDDKTLPPACEMHPPTMVYQATDGIEESFCGDHHCWKRVGPILTAPVDTHFGDVISISSLNDDNLRFVVSAIKEIGCNGEDSGIIRVYDLLEGGGGLKQVGQAIEGVVEKGDARGYISGDGRIVAVGMPSSNGLNDINNIGGWSMLEYDDKMDRWVDLGDPVYGNQRQSRLGHTMALSFDGSIVAVSAPMSDDKMGHVSVYRFNNDTGYRHWEQLGQTIFAQTRNPNDLFGADLDLSDNGLVLAVGQRSHDRSKSFLENKGRVAIFHFINETWEAMGSEILGEQTGDAFGRSVGLSVGGGVLVGGVNGDYAYGISNNGRSAHVRAFTFNQAKSEWEQLGSDIIGNVTLGGNALNKVAINAEGNRIALTTQRVRGVGEGSSQVFEFDKDLNDWRQLGGTIRQEWQTDDHGGSIALSGDGNVVIVGAPADNVNGTVRVYKLLENK